ncbi:phosphodiester glycosidase family protein [Roseicyclus amphidinii]|uniref:phosphodiester glycosidase family protein n=1 Tax=Roseicyclus amphidinii TaxID=3034232 RepID=UPI0024E07A64|nr:phosphodiester glycosidase family protein [Roseicyclus sp. Amp-Y-6]
MIRALVLALALSAGQAAAACEEVVFDGASFTACRIDLAQTETRLFLRDAEGAIYGSFGRVEAALPPGKRLGMAMNAGMFHDDRSPVGHYVENGVEEMRVITSDGPGNFGLLPNGVLCLMEGRARIVESRAFAEAPPACRDATQSGPMLVIDGALHPRFLPDGTSRNIRNGAGVDESGQTLHLVISDEPVNFHHFARFFRDHLGVPQALYFDGRVSRLYAPDMGRADIGLPIGPIIGTVVDAAPADG